MNKTIAIWIGTIATVVSTTVGIATYCNENGCSQDNGPGDTTRSTTLPNIATSGPTTVSMPVPTADACEAEYRPQFELVGKRHGETQEEGYKKIIERAIESQCFNEAWKAVPRLKIKYDQDESYQAIFAAALKAQDFVMAEKAIQKLFLKIDRDAAYEKLEKVQNKGV